MKITLTITSLVVSIVSICWMSFRDHPIRFTASDRRFSERYGSWAILAGASQGLGAAWAHTLCELHVNVLLVARRETETRQLANELMSNYPDIQVDVLIQDLAASDLDQAFDDVINYKHRDREYGMLVYNAAYVPMGSFVDSSLEAQQLSVNVNIRGVLSLTHILSNHIRARNGTGGIILMSSLVGELGTAGVSNYAGTKAWNTAFAHGLRHELSPLGMDVLACVAGPTTTPNYLQVTNVANRKYVMEQTAQAVVSECAQAIGSRSSVRTGIMNKIARFLLVRVLPLEMAIKILNNEAGKVMILN